MKTQEKKQKRVQPKEESLSYTVEVRDKEGRVLQRISAPSRSYVQQWNQLINVHASQVGKTVKDIGGVDRTATPSHHLLRADAGIGIVVNGIRVGKGTTAVAITDVALESPCDEGTDTDEFNHQLVEFTEPSVIGSTCSFTIRRTMINNSGATITGIKEIGCYHKYSYTFMSFRDVLPSPVSVPHGGSITVTYTLKVTV
ncbi:hypothetical protein ES703_112782 [subsurface metagenome]